MSMDFFLSPFVPPNPKEIAIPHAERLSHKLFEHTQEDETTLAELEALSGALGFLGTRYFIEGTRGLVIPASLGIDEPTEYSSYGGLMCEGELVSYSRVSVGQFIGHGAVRALCLALDKAIILPTFEPVPKSALLHVPVYAIDEIAKVD